MSNQIIVILILFIFIILFSEYMNMDISPSKVFSQYNEDLKPKPITITINDFYAVGKGGTLFTGQYNEYHFIGNDTNGLNFEFINNNDYKYHIAQINTNMTFICYGNMRYCN